MRRDSYERLQERSRREFGNRQSFRGGDSERGEENRPQN